MKREFTFSVVAIGILFISGVVIGITNSSGKSSGTNGGSANEEIEKYILPIDALDNVLSLEVNFASNVEDLQNIVFLEDMTKALAEQNVLYTANLDYRLDDDNTHFDVGVHVMESILDADAFYQRQADSLRAQGYSLERNFGIGRNALLTNLYYIAFYEGNVVITIDAWNIDGNQPLIDFARGYREWLQTKL